MSASLQTKRKRGDLHSKNDTSSNNQFFRINSEHSELYEKLTDWQDRAILFSLSTD
jgi:hypothetical protein